MQVVCDGDDAVVGRVFVDALGAGVFGDVDLDGAGVAVGPRAERAARGGGQVAPVDAVGELAQGAEAIEVSDRAAGVSAQVVVLALHLVEFFDDGEGNDDVVFLEDEHRVGVVQQDVGVEDEVLDLAVLPCVAGGGRGGSSARLGARRRLAGGGGLGLGGGVGGATGATCRALWSSAGGLIRHAQRGNRSRFGACRLRLQGWHHGVLS